MSLARQMERDGVAWGPQSERQIMKRWHAIGLNGQRFEELHQQIKVTAGAGLPCELHLP
jgi:hypothetical protein